MSRRQKTNERFGYGLINDFYDDQIILLLNRWLEVKQELTEVFESRESKRALEPMKQGIDVFQKFLFWSNGNELILEEKYIKELKWKPFNVSERLTFIKNRPNVYHSFIQLNELMNEQEKLYNKKLVIEKVTKQ